MVHRGMIPADNVIMFTYRNNKERYCYWILQSLCVDCAGGVVRPKKF